MRKTGFLLLAAIGGLVGSAIAAPAGRLQWEQSAQTNNAHIGDVSAKFIFSVKNVSDQEITIDNVRASCGCTVAEPPRQPWHMRPKSEDKMDVLVDLRGKTPGTFIKDITVVGGGETNVLLLTVNIPNGMTNGMSMAMMNRLWGQQLAGVDHQAVFKKDCVKCHLEPAFGKSGVKLYQVACGICHEAEHRATMVPDLHLLKTEIDTNYWRNWVMHGKAGTLMPGFAATEGGPLDDEQIKSLVKYLTNAFPRPIKPEPAPVKAAMKNEK